MASYIDELKKALDTFNGVKAALEDIRKCKSEIQGLKERIYENNKVGYFLRDDRRIILSAPEIVIGNVDHSGILLEGGGTVVIRGNAVELQGTGSPSSGGRVVTRAASIRQEAVDPGKDGLENVVIPGHSSIVNKAVSISIDSENATGVMARNAAVPHSGVSIVSDTSIEMDAVSSNKLRTDNISGAIKQLDKLIKSIGDSIRTHKSDLDKVIDFLSDGSSQMESGNEDEISLRTNYEDLLYMREMFVTQESGLCATLEKYYRDLSIKAEAIRAKEALDKMKGTLGKQSSGFADKTTGASLSVKAETVLFSSVDGDGNIKKNDEAGFFVSAPHVSFRAHDVKGALIDKSTMDVNFKKLNISTATAKYEDTGHSKGTFTSVGDIDITSKNLTYKAVDTKLDGGKITETALTKDSRTSWRTEDISFNATDTEGKSTGKLNLNAKNIQIASMNVDKEKRTDTEMAADSRMVLLSDKIYEGAIDQDKNKGKLVQVAASSVGVMADETAEIQQGKADAAVTLSSGKLSAGGGSGVELSGDTTIKGNADIKGETESPKGTFKSLEAGSQFKSPNISDGMPAGPAGKAAKPSAKLKMEQVKTTDK